MEFAAITETLLIDADGVYDPGDVNDRMLLGMKSTIGEVELHVMAQRLQASKRAAAERGELRTPLPVGYVHDEAGEIVIDPDAEVQAAIGDLFAAFAACGSAYGVVAAFADRRFPLRAYGGAWAGQLRWGALTHARVLGVLKNPCYAGAYVHGRYTSRRRVDPDGTVHTGLIERPRSRVAGADPRSPRRLHRLGRLPGQRGQAGGQPHQRRGPTAARGIRAVSGHHRLRILRQADAHQLPHRSATRLRVLRPRRPAHHPDLPVDRRVHGGRGGDRTVVGSVEPQRDRARAGRRRRGRRPAPANRSRRRTRRRTRPLRGRPGRTRLPRGRAGQPARGPQPGNPVGSQTRRPRRSRAGTRGGPGHAAAATRAGRNWRNSPPTCPGSGTRPPPATRTANGCCAP